MKGRHIFIFRCEVDSDPNESGEREKVRSSFHVRLTCNANSHSERTERCLCARPEAAHLTAARSNGSAFIRGKSFLHTEQHSRRPVAFLHMRAPPFNVPNAASRSPIEIAKSVIV